MIKLTPRQQEILDFIKSTLEVLGAPPTRMEISSAFGFASPNAAEDHLKALAKKGAIVLELYRVDGEKRIPRHGRGVALTAPGEGHGLGAHRADQAIHVERRHHIRRGHQQRHAHGDQPQI